MRDPLRCNIELRHFWFWKTAVAVVGWTAISAVCGWLGSGSQTRSTAVWVTGLVAVGALFALALSLSKVDPGTLRRERGEWSFLPSSSNREAPETGELAVAIDLGAFMLLVLTRAGGGGRRWLPAQRFGHERAWHELRCAAHAPRPPTSAVGAPE